jgi:hypothetical protein
MPVVVLFALCLTVTSSALVLGQEYAGSESCAQCHDKVGAYLESKMARTNAEGAQCVTCHMSQLGGGLSEPGVACERCHGPAGKHASTNGASPVRTPSKLGAAERDATCAQCHDQRGASHVEALAASKCKQVSGERLWCNTCHDPHRTIAAVERDAHFLPKCRGCHAQAHADGRGRENCLGCHMPKSEARGNPHVVRTDHRIPRVFRSGAGAGVR